MAMNIGRPPYVYDASNTYRRVIGKIAIGVVSKTLQRPHGDACEGKAVVVMVCGKPLAQELFDAVGCEVLIDAC